MKVADSIRFDSIRFLVGYGNSFLIHQSHRSFLSFASFAPNVLRCISISNEKKVPETKGVEEGSAKRNITRRHDHDPHRKEKKQGGGGGGKGKWNPTDDGSF